MIKKNFGVWNCLVILSEVWINWAYFWHTATPTKLVYRFIYTVPHSNCYSRNGNTSYCYCGITGGMEVRSLPMRSWHQRESSRLTHVKNWLQPFPSPPRSWYRASATDSSVVTYLYLGLAEVPDVARAKGWKNKMGVVFLRNTLTFLLF